MKALKEYLNEAKFYLDALNKRNQTMMIIVNELIKIQKGHFLYNDELHPCTLKDLSEITGFAISTISRTLSNKYYSFNNEERPIKELFVSSTKMGSSKDSIEKAIIYFIQNEDKDNPLKDEELVIKLEELELYASRRTISKYREGLKIDNSKIRKKKYKNNL